MAKSGALRDTQKNKVYAWESSGNLHAFWDRTKMNISKEAVHHLCHDIMRVGGFTKQMIDNFKIQFNVRNGNAYANARGVNFTSWNTPKILVLHEMAHALTFGHSNPYWPSRCLSGHSGVFMGCYMALLERYLGLNIIDLARSLQRPIEKKKMVRSYNTTAPSATLPRQYHVVDKVETKIINPPVFDPHALKHWRTKFGAIS